LKAVLRKGYKVPTPIQRKAVPIIMGGSDVVAMARTGSGKTAAFVLPMLHKLQKHSFQFGARGLILSPTRELALQTLKFCKELGHFTDLRYCCLIGGDNMEDQFSQLTHNPDMYTSLFLVCVCVCVCRVCVCVVLRACVCHCTLYTT
jgi:ATP-dependent RNA helicase DDX54/DBP10